MESLVADPLHTTRWSKNVTRLCSTLLDLPPSCIEFMPQSMNASMGLSSSAAAEYFVVGTYDLETNEDAQSLRDDDDGSETDSREDRDSDLKKPQSRNGSLSLFRFRDNHVSLLETRLTESAILDLHFLKDSSAFAVVSSTGMISFYRLKHDASIQPIQDHQLFEKETLILSFCWYPCHLPVQENGNSPDYLIMATTSLGDVWLVRIARDFRTVTILNPDPLIHHDDNAWCSSFSLGTAIFSGGDDSKVRTSDLSPYLSPWHDEAMSKLSRNELNIFTGHNAGVTAILVLPSVFGLFLLTGSFDDYVRVYLPYDPTSLYARPRTLAELKIGDGVWRLKFLHASPPPGNPNENVKFTVLASCMRKGARILEVRSNSDGEWSITVLAAYWDHDSMNYASDVQPILEDFSLTETEQRVCVSTSFYDRKLRVWRWDPERNGLESSA